MRQMRKGAPVLTIDSKMPTLRDRQRELRTNAILDHAQAMLTRHRYANVTIDAIAAEVGISKQTLYTHFPSKEDLCVAILCREMERGIERFDRLLDGHTPLEALRVIIALSLDAHYGRNTLFGYAIGTTLFSDDRILAAERRLAARIVAVLAAGQDAGVVRTDLHPLFMAQTLHSILKDVAHEPATRAAGLDRDAVHRHLMALFSVEP